MTDTNWSDEFLLTAKSPREMRLARTVLRQMVEELDAHRLTGHTIVENDIGVRVMAYDSAGEIAINLGFEKDGVRPDA